MHRTLQKTITDEDRKANTAAQKKQQTKKKLCFRSRNSQIQWHYDNEDEYLEDEDDDDVSKVVTWKEDGKKTIT